MIFSFVGVAEPVASLRHPLLTPRSPAPRATHRSRSGTSNFHRAANAARPNAVVRLRSLGVAVGAERDARIVRRLLPHPAIAAGVRLEVDSRLASQLWELCTKGR